MIDVAKKLLAILSSKERLQAYLLLIPMSFSALLEVCGIAFVVPFMVVVSNPAILHQSKKFNLLYRLSHCSSPHSFLLLLGFVVLFLLIFGNAVSALTNMFIVRYAAFRGHSIACRLIQHYLNQPYEYFLDQHSANLNKIIFVDVFAVVTGVLLPYMRMLSKVVAILFIVFLLFAVKPLLALSVVVVIGGLYGLTILVVRHKLADISFHLVDSQRKCFRIVNETFGGIKDVKVLNNADYFINKYIKNNIRYAKSNITSSLIGQLPRAIFETIIFGITILAVLLFLSMHRDTSNITSLLALYAFAAYRLMPSVQLIFSSFAKIKSQKGSLDIVYENYKNIQYDDYAVSQDLKFESHAQTDFQFAKQLEMKDVVFSYPNSQNNVLNNFNVTIQANTVVGFVGATGSGKTTSIDLISGLLFPQKGQLLIDNVELEKKDLYGWHKKIGYMTQNIYLCDDTVINNIAFGVPENEIDLKAVEAAAKNSNIHDFIMSELSEGYHSRIGERGIRLSGGQRQRLGLARVLYRNPELIILDEATSALDGITEAVVMEAIHNLAGKKTIIIIAHRLTTLKKCDIIFVLKDGSVIKQGSYEFLRENCDSFREMLRETIK